MFLQMAILALLVFLALLIDPFRRQNQKFLLAFVALVLTGTSALTIYRFAWPGIQALLEAVGFALWIVLFILIDGAGRSKNVAVSNEGLSRPASDAVGRLSFLYDFRLLRRLILFYSVIVLVYLFMRSTV